jgi:hypothetical protein
VWGRIAEPVDVEADIGSLATVRKYAKHWSDCWMSEWWWWGWWQLGSHQVQTNLLNPLLLAGHV